MNRLLSVFLLALPMQEPKTEPIDFSKVSRTIDRPPQFVTDKPLYGLFLFGKNGETRVWAVLDKQNAAKSDYDVLYLDVNANGDLTESNERFVAEPGNGSSTFKIGRFVQPGTPSNAPRVHTEFSITWSTLRVGYRMNWNGGPVTMGCYGPDAETYGKFGKDAESALIVVPGHDLPFQFETWLSNQLTRTGENSFKVFVGNRGSATGGFSTVDDKFLQSDEFVIATLIYKDRAGNAKNVRYELRERC